MKAYLSLIKHALNDHGFTIDVVSMEGLEVENSSSYKEVKDMIEALDDLPVLRFYGDDRVYRGSAHINLFVNDDETVMDHSMNHTRPDANPANSDKWIEDWFNEVVMA